MKKNSGQKISCYCPFKRDLSQPKLNKHFLGEKKKSGIFPFHGYWGVTKHLFLILQESWPDKKFLASGGRGGYEILSASA
jgi:hypothetical protein